MSGLGGVRSQGPRAIAQGQPAIQPLTQPQYQPMPVGPWPGVIVTPQSGAPGPSVPSWPNQPLRIPGTESIVVPSETSGLAGNVRNSSGSGLGVNGSYSDDRFRLAFHLGSDAFRRALHHHHGYPIVYTYPTFWGYPTWWYDDYRSYYGYRYGTIYGNSYVAQPTVAAPQPVPQSETPMPSTQRELGDTYFMAGDARAAIKAYESHLKQYPGDEDAMRALGFALIDNGQTTEGVAMVAMAYKAEPLLADRPVPAEAFRDGALSRDLSRASVYANRVKSASGWLTVAVYMQAQGREDLARTMVERARAAGLESLVADRLAAALR